MPTRIDATLVNPPHPPVEPWRVDIAGPEHWLVRGIEPFDTDDELYLSEYHDLATGCTPSCRRPGAGTRKASSKATGRGRLVAPINTS